MVTQLTAPVQGHFLLPIGVTWISSACSGCFGAAFLSVHNQAFLCLTVCHVALACLPDFSAARHFCFSCHFWSCLSPPENRLKLLRRQSHRAECPSPWNATPMRMTQVSWPCLWASSWLGSSAAAPSQTHRRVVHVMVMEGSLTR